MTPLFSIGATSGAAFARLLHLPTGLFAAFGFVSVVAGLDVRMDVAIGDLTRSEVQVRPGCLVDRVQRASSRFGSRDRGESEEP